MQDRSICTWLLISVLLAGVSVNAGANVLKEGFAGIPWGSGIERLAGLEPVGAKKDVRFFQNPKAVLTIDEIVIKEVIYGFYHGKFFAAYVNLDSMETFGRLRRYLNAQFGEPELKWEVRSGLRIYRWTQEDIRIKLKSRENEGPIKIAFYFLPLARALNEARLDEMQDTKWRLFPIERDKQPEFIPLFKF